MCYDIVVYHPYLLVYSEDFAVQQFYWLLLGLFVHIHRSLSVAFVKPFCLRHFTLPIVEWLVALLCFIWHIHRAALETAINAYKAGFLVTSK